MHFTYQTEGTCSLLIEFDLIDDAVYNVHYFGGCNGNLQALSRLVEGMPADEVIAKLKGINCGGKGTSCADQLTQAIEEARLEIAKNA